MTQFQIHNPNYVQIVQDSFAQQGLMHHLGAKLVTVAAGLVTIELPFAPQITQQHNFIHAGALTSVVDSACGYAALTLMPPDSDVLSVEFKVNFMAPARGELAIAHGRVIKPGRTVTICEGDVYMVNAQNEQKHCVRMLATMIRR